MQQTAQCAAGQEDLARLDVADPAVWQEARWPGMFRRLRQEAPVHYCADSVYGPYFSVTRHADVMAVEAQPDIYSSASELGGIAIMDALGEISMPHFLATDRPRHTAQRRVVAPAFNPSEISRMSSAIRQRTGDLLDSLPIGKPFDWVSTVSIELTTAMLAVLFAFPWEDRHKLPYWSDWFGNIEAYRRPELNAERIAAATDCAAYFSRLWDERLRQPIEGDLLSMMAHSEALGRLSPLEWVANLSLLIVGGNDTTRSSMTAAAIAFGLWPEEYRKLAADPSLAANAAQEIIRWQSPLAHMRRTATQDTELAGTRIPKGSRVILWYASANRDETLFDDADRVHVDRPNARRHLAFGFGIHRCVGARLAEIQLQILFEELLARNIRFAGVAPPVRQASAFVNGFADLQVVLQRP